MPPLPCPISPHPSQALASTSTPATLPVTAPARGERAATTVFPGLLLAMIIAGLSLAFAQLDWMSTQGVSGLNLALLIGAVLGNTVYPRWAPPCRPGIDFSKQSVLRVGIVLYGLQLGLQDIQHIGWRGVAIDGLVLGSTFALALWLGIRRMGMDRNTVMLIGAGSSICGAAAVMATAPVIKARDEHIAVAIATVVVFGTLALVLYPLLYTWIVSTWGGHVQINRLFGLYIGSTVHEVAQVVATGQAINHGIAQDAIVTKLVRVLMLAPFLFVLALALNQAGRRQPRSLASEHSHAVGEQQALRLNTAMVPWFALAFLAVVCLHSLIPLPPAWTHALQQVDSLLLGTAMAALGLSTHHSALRRAGYKPMLLAGLLFIWLVMGGGLINALLS